MLFRSAILRRQRSYTIPLLRIQVSRDIALLLVPAGLIVLWSQFGFLLSETIDLRMGLWRIAGALEAPQAALVNKPYGVATGLTNETQGAWVGATNSQDRILQDRITTNDWYNATYTFGHKRVLHDGGFLDGWFNSFRPEETLIARSNRAVVCAVVLWGIFCGLANACILACIWERGKRAIPPWERFCLSSLFVGITGYLLLSHWTFMWPCGHQNWMQPITLLVGALAVWVLAAGRSIPQTVIKKISSWFPSPEPHKTAISP